jgi:hypothetical protein
MARTLQEKIIGFLESRGYKKVEARTSMYIAMRKEGELWTYFVGSHGALRRSSKGTSSTSVSVKLNKEAFETYCASLQSLEE